MVTKSSKLISSARPLDPLRRFLWEQEEGVGNVFKTEAHLAAAHSPRETGPSKHSLYLQWLSQPWVLLPSAQLMGGHQGAPGGLVQPLCCTPPTQKPPSGGLGETQAAVSVGRGLLGMHGAQSWAVIHQVRLVILSFRSKGSGSHPGAKSRLLPAFI